jgi:hypothetical protein
MFRLILSLSFVVAILADDNHRALITSAHEKREHIQHVRDLINTTIICRSPEPYSTASLFDHLSRVFCLEVEQRGLAPEMPFQKIYNMSGKSHTFSIFAKDRCAGGAKKLTIPKRTCHKELGDIWFKCRQHPI